MGRNVMLDWRQQPWHRYDSFKGTKLLKSHAMVFKSCRHSLTRMEDSTMVVTSEKRRIDKMLCEQEKSVTLTKNNIGWSEDSYREASWEIHADEARNTICLCQKSSVARCESNQLLM